MRSYAILGALGALALASTSAAVAAAPTKPEHSCFFITQWQGWKSPSPDILYLKVNLHDVYQVDLSSGSSELQWPDVHLVSKVRGSDSICNALDLDLSVSDGHGFYEPLIAKSIVKLTPEQIAAIPPKYRP
jgi:hypothetical protein